MAGWSDRFQRFPGRDPDQPDRHFRSLQAASSEDLSPSHDLPVMLGLHVPYPISYLVILSNSSNNYEEGFFLNRHNRSDNIWARSNKKQFKSVTNN